MNDSLINLFILAIPIACIAWTVTQEEIFSELQQFCSNRYKQEKSFSKRKLYYLFTCEYCFSHYVTVVFLILTRYKLLFEDWRGYLISGFALVWIANVYMSTFQLLRQGLKKEKIEANLKEVELKEVRSDKEKYL
ncbi:MAG TPA: hypothetical protein PK076_01785 [Saprospiraceae bacterium]|nr:hypothetical protein [Saprospiraceae bacterium]HQW54821.1 hypothetical protein [Saprospiraceae bacterium]